MASWLRAAEDLFEVVDRRAKLVVGENSEEQSNFQSPASNGRGSQTKRTRLKAKAQKRLSSNETPKTVDTSSELNSSETSQPNVVPDKDGAGLTIETDGIIPSNSNAQTSNEQQLNVENDGSIPSSSKSESILSEEVKDSVVHEELPVIVPDVEAIASTSNGELVNEDSSDVLERVSSSEPDVQGVEIVHEDPPVDTSQDFRMRDAGISAKIEQEGHHSVSVDTPNGVDTPLKDADSKVESHSDQKKQQDHKADASPTKVQDQLEEAQGLLKTAISTGQSKEARLARVCAGLSSRLQEYKSENAQLEELLVAERELSRSSEARIKQLQRDISAAKSEVIKVESNLADALAAKNSEIESLVSSVDALKKQAALSEGNLASLQANMESIMRNRELTETRMMQALREELTSVERRAEEERAAHNSTKMAAMERQVELEHRAMEASTALARIQRTADERTSKAAELEHKVALMEVECASLNQELQDLESRARRGQKKSPEEANQMIQMQAWQEEVERARQGQRDAESKLSSLEANVQKLRVEMAAMKRDAEHYSRQEHMELEKRYRELTDLLYYKQTQLETMASEKAAAEFQLEKEMKRLQETQQVETERIRASRRASSSWEEDTDIKALEPLPLYHRHMVGASMQLQKAAKLLDSGAVRATRFLWRYPTARLLLLFYLVFVHLFLMYLLHRLQEQADSFYSREVAVSMGLANPTLP
ncbi:golgin candidate 1 isoform X1 [Rhododendron vialii]|uniref:golgin candidate 1 isoform X1 n=1 Tax=Rhododendron vialii TaxID=182163 RepID=UPI00265DCB7E|nr:golgin candidate 1 isoform X1 [Rhododendron vialii]